MKRKIQIVLIYFIFILISLSLAAGLLAPYIYWKSLGDKPLNVWIVDKTVPVPDYREHRALIWLMNYFKIVKETDRSTFDYAKDYYGFFPVNRSTYNLRPLEDVQGKPDLIYITDTYGVYTDDYMIPNVRGTRSELIYGGLTDSELKKIKDNLSDGNTFIGEFNIASSPTNTQNRKELGRLFGVQWTGWKGRYFREMKKDVEVPVWVVENYEKQHGTQWGFTGPGFVLVSDDDQIEVMEMKKHIGEKLLRMNFGKEYASEFDIQANIPYYYWFEFVKASPVCETLASFTLDVTDDGRKMLSRLGLEPVFPAIIRNKNTQYSSYYFCGDFADMKNIIDFWSYFGLDRFKWWTVADNKGDPDYFFWKCYTPMMKKIFQDITDHKQVSQNQVKNNNQQEKVSRTQGQKLQILQSGIWKDFYIKGVNLGSAVPGKWFTEFPEDENTYLRWLKMIGEMNANTIRVYTLLPPEFYKALAYYNSQTSHPPIWLLQEIWPEEEPEGKNYLGQKYNEDYVQEIRYDIDAIHGKARIPERKGRAYGIYTADVSSYVLGYLVGRELDPEEVMETDRINSGFRYEGNYLKTTKAATPTEGWLAMSCDRVVDYEENTYGMQHPVAIVSWPTLDPIEHDSEVSAQKDKTNEFNDITSVDINHIDTGDKMRGGLFGAYHIYPNYPDFMNNEESYFSYKDEQGRLLYGGYLKEFMSQHQKYPAIVGEFGLATGMGNAHSNPDGLNHGGMTEEQQGEGIVRMMNAIKREGYAGGLIFEWMDEWAKKTWTTEPYMIPYERHVLWHNMVDPEQNYGILANEVEKPEKPAYSVKGRNAIRSMEVRWNEEYLYMDFALDKQLDFSKEKMMIGLGTLDKWRGDIRFPDKQDFFAPTGMEFVVDINGKDDARLLVQREYNTADAKYSPVAAKNGDFVEMKPIINKERIRKNGSRIPAVLDNASKLWSGSLEENSRYNIYIKDNEIQIRISWMRLNISDPTTLRVIDDKRSIVNPLSDQLMTSLSDGINIYSIVFNKQNDMLLGYASTIEPVHWNSWTLSKYQERLKKSYNIIQSYFAKLD